MNISKYNDNLEKEWDTFVEMSLNGTVYHTRKFLNYHPKDRFEDESILIYEKDEIVCIVPACKVGEKYFSHPGATYGGPVIKDKNYFRIKNLQKIINIIFDYYDNKLEMRIANDIYFNDSQSTLIYLLSQKLNVSVELSWYIKQFNPENIRNKWHKKCLSNMKNNENEYSVSITNDIEDYTKFYSILTKTLSDKHESTPTHTLEELLLLKNILKDNQKLCIIKHNTTVIAGMFFIETTPRKYYTMYISKDYSYDKINSNQLTCCLLLIVEYFSNNVDFDILDFGICTEDRGTVLNSGLSIFKEDSLTGISDYRYIFTSK